MLYNKTPFYRHHFQSVHVAASYHHPDKFSFMVASSQAGLIALLRCRLLLQLHLKDHEVRAVPVSVPSNTAQKNVCPAQNPASCL